MVQKTIFTGNSTLGGAGLDWNMQILNATNPTDSLGNAHLQMGYVKQITSKFVQMPSKNGSFTVQSQVYNRSSSAMPPTNGMVPAPNPGMVTPPFYVWNQNASRIVETNSTWNVEIVGGFNGTRTPKGPYDIQLNVYDSSGNSINFGYIAWEGTKSPVRKVAVGRVGLVSGGYGESWTFGKTDLQGNIIYSVAKGAPWKIVVNLTAAEFSNVTLGFRLDDNVKTFVNVTGWYTRTITEYGGWVNNSTSGTYYWNSSAPVTRTEKAFGPHQEEQWLWIPHRHVVNVTNSFWNFTSQKMQLVNATQDIMDEWLILIYDHTTQEFSLKQGYKYSSYDPVLAQQRQLLVLQDLNTSDPTTRFYS
ncbi:hypothetical protein MUP79_10520, partial [Candidatus Bathyarchaeota archaeon]|nr:hypothetical protein [Candidatus Bathyarchaeota archaeon]